MPSDYISELSPEERLLLSLCRLDFSDKQKTEIASLVSMVTDWDHFVTLANEHCVIALCWYNLTDTGNTGGIPPGKLDLLHSAYLKSLAQNARLLQQLEEIASLANKEDIKIVMLKGGVLERTYYGDKGLRQLSDIDLLTRPEDAIHLRDLLLKNGFVSVPLISPLHRNLLPWIKKHLPLIEKNGIAVEIHVKLFENDSASLTNELFNTSYRPAGNNGGYFYPVMQFHFLYLIQHLYRHLKTKDLKLKLYTDLVILLKKDGSNILNKQLGSLLGKVHLEKEFRSLIEIINIFWGTDFKYIPEWAEDSTDYRESARLFINFLRFPLTDISNKKSEPLLKPLKEIPGFINKLKFLTGYLFPSFLYMKYKYNSRTYLSALLFYPVRLANLAGRMIVRKRVH